MCVFNFQTGKKKKHDTLDKMAQFSKHWRKYPVLYDEKARNSLFAKDWKNAASHLMEAYTKLASATGLTVDNVKGKCLKYKDAVTKAVGQFVDDVRHGSNNMPTPAAVKLIVFFGLCHSHQSMMLLCYSTKHLTCMSKGSCRHG